MRSKILKVIVNHNTKHKQQVFIPLQNEHALGMLEGNLLSLQVEKRQ